MNELLCFFRDNIIILILCLVTIVLLFRLLLFPKKSTKQYHTSGNNIISKKQYTLDDCTSLDDLKFQLSEYQRSINDALQKHEKIIKDAQQRGYIKSSIAWTKQSEKLSRISNTLYSNLEHENSKRLTESKFHRYTNLHYRSMILDHIAYQDYCASKKVRDEISQTILSAKNRTAAITKAEKNELYLIKDACVNTTRLLYERMVAIQSQTRTLKLKIRDECGIKGRTWSEKIEKNKQH